MNHLGAGLSYDPVSPARPDGLGTTQKDRTPRMAQDVNGKEILAGALGVLALALGGGTILGVLRPPGGVMAVGVPPAAIVGLLAGVVGLYLGRTRGVSRQLAVVGTGVALIGLGLIASSMAHAMKQFGLVGEIVGYAKTEDTRRVALEIGICDRVFGTAKAA